MPLDFRCESCCIFVLCFYLHLSSRELLFTLCFVCSVANSMENVEGRGGQCKYDDCHARLLEE